MFPKKIEIINSQNLKIVWDNDQTSVIPLVKLRNNCPCAVCKADKDEKGDSYIPLYYGDQLKVSEINLLGYYAISIGWQDGHNIGIYEFSHLLKLSE